MTRAALAVLLAAGLLTACDTHAGEHCVSSHQQYTPPTYQKVGKTSIPVGGGMTTVCDRYEPDSPS